MEGLPRAALTMDWDFSTGANCCSAAKRSFVAGFSGLGKTISGCATRRDGRLIPASKTLTRGGLTNIQVPTVSENSEAQNISSVLDCVSRNLDLG
jgi:hypothetical protein